MLPLLPSIIIPHLPPLNYDSAAPVVNAAYPKVRGRRRRRRRRRKRKQRAIICSLMGGGKK